MLNNAFADLEKALAFLAPEEIARIIINRYQDLRFCNKRDVCNIEAMGIDLVIGDLIYEHTKMVGKNENNI